MSQVSLQEPVLKTHKHPQVRGFYKINPENYLRPYRVYLRRYLRMQMPQYSSVHSIEDKILQLKDYKQKPDRPLREHRKNLPKPNMPE